MRTVLIAGIVALLAAPAVAAAQAAAPDLALVEAVKAGEQAAAVSLLDRRADPNARSADGTTALHWATRNNDAMLVDRLLRAGARPHQENRYGVTPIALACERTRASWMRCVATLPACSSSSGRRTDG